MTAHEDSPPPAEPLDHDEVEELMVSCLEGPEEGWARSLEAAARDHPEHAQELRERLEALLAVDSPPPPAAGSGGPLGFRPPDRLGDFTDLVALGSGGMGLVFRARQESLDREVALKLIRPERLFFDASLARFQREVETVARLRHPGIVAIHSVGRAPDSDLPYFAMELLGGATLADVLEFVRERAPESLAGRDLFEAVGGDAPQPPELFTGTWTDACLRVALQVGRALEHAHVEGVVHRDVKPSNVMLEPSGRTVLIDFGLTATRAGGEDRVTASGHPVGTLVYMAPEQLEDEAELDGRADVYALGVTLYELLALQAPFDGASAAGVQRAVLLGEADPVRARNRRVPADVQTVVRKAMERRRADRYESASALCADLENLLARRPIAARPPGPAKRVLRWAQRRPAAAVATGLAALLALGVPSVLLALSSAHAKELEAVANQERAAKERALAANAELEDVVAFTLGMFQRADPQRNGGDVPDAREMLALGAAELPRLAGRPASHARIQLELGELFGVLTEPEASRPHLDAAIRYYGDGTDALSRERLARALRYAGHNDLMQGRLAEAEPKLTRALEVARELYGPDSVELHPFHATLADLYDHRQDFPAALRERRRTVLLLEDHGEGDPRLARARGLLGVTLKLAGELAPARERLEAALAWDAARSADEPGLQAERALFRLTLSDVEKLEGRHEESLALAREAGAELQTTRGPDSLLTQQAEMAEAEALGNLARYEEALAILDGLAERVGERLAPAHPLVLRIRLLTVACLNGLGHQPEIAPYCVEHRLVAAFTDAHGASHPNTIRVLRAQAISHQARDENLESLGLLDELEAAERAASPWSADHADAIFMLAVLRLKLRASDEKNGPAATAALLKELVTAVEGKGLTAQSAINGTTYDVEATARSFLKSLGGE